MITIKQGDLLRSPAQTLVNTVNCVGVMGKGIALAFKKRFPDMFADYEARCERHEVHLGAPYIYKGRMHPWVINFPTKDHWRAVSRLADIVRGLEYLEAHIAEWGVTSLAVPPLGCGNGQLEWKVVGPTLYRYLARLNIPVELYAPGETPSDQLTLQFLDGTASPSVDTEERISANMMAIVAALFLVEREQYHWPVGRIGIQKLCYFATDQGVPTQLVYQRASYGPFSENLMPLITKLQNNGLIVERKVGNMFALHTGPTARDALKAYADQLAPWKPALLRAVDLYLRAPAAQVEVAATALFVARELAQARATVSEHDVFEGVARWKIRRRPAIAPEEIGEAVRNLNALGWVQLAITPDLPMPAGAEA